LRSRTIWPPPTGAGVAIAFEEFNEFIKQIAVWPEVGERAAGLRRELHFAGHAGAIVSMLKTIALLPATLVLPDPSG
jgi:hypothetical protein